MLNFKIERFEKGPLGKNKESRTLCSHPTITFIHLLEVTCSMQVNTPYMEHLGYVYIFI